MGLRGSGVIRLGIWDSVYAWVESLGSVGLWGLGASGTYGGFRATHDN